MVMHHRSQFKNTKRSPTQSDAQLAKENRAGRIEFDENRADTDYEQDQGRKKQSCQKIEAPFELWIDKRRNDSTKVFSLRLSIATRPFSDSLKYFT